MPELRKDPITHRWVILAPEYRRPLPAAPERRAAAGLCPFCAGNENLTPAEIAAWRPVPDGRGNGPDWKIRIIPNRFPVLRIEGVLDSRAEGLYDKANGIGANEVVIPSPDHAQDLDALPLEHGEQLWTLVRDRFLDLRNDARLQYLQLFANRGEAAGANLSHPHLQLVGLPLIPNAVQEEYDGFLRHRAHRGRCVYCDILRQETRSPERLVAENEHFLSLTPYASRFPFEVWILPKAHQAAFSDLGRSETRAWAKIVQDTLARLKRALRDPDYNLVLHTAPLQISAGQDFHWHLEILPQLGRRTGFEWGTGMAVNATPPEEAAGFLRDAGL